MNPLIIILFVIIAIALGYTIFLILKRGEENSDSRERKQLLESKIRLESELERKNESLGEMRNEIRNISRERDELGGRYEILFLEKTALISDKKHLEQKLGEMQEKISRHDAESIRKNQEFEEKIQKLSNVEKALEDERQRIRKNDENEQKKREEERERIWNDHEKEVVARLRDICQKPSIGFTFYDNTNTPVSFSKYKPDGIIPFLGQYIVFDAKKSKNIRTYIQEQIKTTVKKYKDLPDIYPMIFFVVPKEEIEELKSLSSIEGSFTFHIISIESIEPILTILKKIKDYETLSDFDPEDREQIVHLIANYDRHISLQNAANILFTRDSLALMNSKEQLHKGIQDDISNRKDSMRTNKINESEIRHMAQNLEEQGRQIERLLAPKISLEKDSIEEIKKILT